MSIDVSLDFECKQCKQLLGSNVTECTHCLNYNNQSRLLIQNFMTDDEAKAMDRVVKFVENVADMSLENTFRFVRHLRSLSAGATVAYQNKLIKERINDPKGITKKLNAAEFAQAVREQKDAQRPPREKKLLTAREKAIKSLTDIGVPESIAIERIDSEMTKVGRNPGGTK